MSERTERLQGFQEKQQKYWVERAERNVLQAEKSADELLAIMQNSYKEANKVIENQIRDFYSRFAYNQQISYEEVLKRLDKSQLKLFKDQAKLYYDEAYAKHWKTAYTDKMRTLSGKAYMSRLEELKVNIAHEYQRIAEELNVNLDKGLLDQYTKSFEQAMFNVAHQTGVGLEMPQINSDIVKRTIKEKWVGGNYSDRIWENKDKLVEVLNKDLPTMFTLGKHPNVVAQMLSGKLENNYKNTVRLVRTEFNRIANESTADAYSEYGIDKYEILSTLDSRTSEICAEMDGKVFEFKNKEIGVNYPPFHPNCRTTTVPYFPEDVNDKRIAKDLKGKNFHVPASMKFEEWHERAYGYKKYNKDGETYVYDNKKPTPQPEPVLIPQAKPVEKKADKTVIKEVVKQAETQPMTESEINKYGRKVLYSNWEEYRKKFVGHGAEVDFSKLDSSIFYDTVKIGNYKDKETVIKAISQIENLSSEFYSPLQKLKFMEKEEAFFTKAFASSRHYWETASAEIRFNPTKINEEGLKRIQELSSKGYSVKIPKGKEIEYLVTHEYGHCILNVGERLPSKARNFVQTDFVPVKKARKEINKIWESYTSNVKMLEDEYEAISKPINSRMIFDGIAPTEEERAIVSGARSKLEATKISKYSLTSQDEFIAEAFADVVLNENPSEYSKQVYDVLKKYFGKE